MTPAMEVRLFVVRPGEGWEYTVRPGEGWEYTVRRRGEVIAASDGDDHFEHAGRALKAAIESASAYVKQELDGGEA